MKRKIKYTDDMGEMRGKLVRIPDNLPSQAAVRRAIARGKPRIYTDDKGELDGIWRRIRPGEFPEIDELVVRLDRKRKVTLELDNVAIDFFKREAGKRKTSYQRMIRALLLAYARQHAAKKVSRA